MKVYDINGNELNSYDLSIGRLEKSTRTEHRAATEPIEEIARWEEKHYPNGSISRWKIVEREAVEGKAAWDEIVECAIYKPYTEEELAQIEAERNKPTAEERIAELEAALAALLEGETV